jgi:hypothetical protein
MVGFGVRIGRRLTVWVVVLVALLVGIDRIGNYAAERAAADTIRSSQGLQQTPSVDIAGFPFLTQLAAGRFGQITVTAHNVVVGNASRSITLDSVQVVLHTITVARDFSKVHADTATAAAVLGYPALTRFLGIDVSYAESGRIRGTKTVTIAGVPLTGSLTTLPQLSGDSVTVTQTNIDDVGILGTPLAVLLDNAVSVPIPLDGVPFNVHLTGLTATPSGVVVDLAGSDLTYSS